MSFVLLIISFQDYSPRILYVYTSAVVSIAEVFNKHLLHDINSPFLWLCTSSALLYPISSSLIIISTQYSLLMLHCCITFYIYLEFSLSNGKMLFDLFCVYIYKISCYSPNHYVITQNHFRTKLHHPHNKAFFFF